jgi:hypothetical protein
LSASLHAVLKRHRQVEGSPQVCATTEIRIAHLFFRHSLHMLRKVRKIFLLNKNCVKVVF